ncbi:class I SAM-dependent methyltransferase [Arthrobacter crystallopoietes]|uniref:Methyltransferase domain-containing protein n=1 Tax=Crystallibacter crystallopoietes TaxID=37928 RepID=A0A1H1A514_9MICC|nr:class I SAM-dependent methyltransferase [Arthrobacter crystallopoietes]AUI51677.1 hypothetical protein AC20117_13570 [Arthrobacter crystallopoietes]SDQ34700.1 Methyltransferase domain-containing protein [Arthrobacter crystallopoietes]
MGNYERDLTTYYDRQAEVRDARTQDPQREAKRSEFIEHLKATRRHDLLEIGCGTGVDGLAFKAAGIRYTGVDLSEASVRIARHKQLEASVASARELPFADETFDAAWTMSTLLHVANADLYGVLTEIMRVLKPGSPLAVGLWSGSDSEGINAADDQEPQRFFSRRSDETLLSLFEPHGTIRDFSTWEHGQDPGHYQYFIIYKP